MGRLFTYYKTWTAGSLIKQLIGVNVLLFLLYKIAEILTTLFVINLPVEWWQIASLPASISNIATQPWSIISYMFMHQGTLHILFNMLWLWWFGQLFLHSFTPRQLGGLYLLGGIGGALLYILAYQTIPYFQPAANNSYLLGASASVYAIVVAIALYKPHQEIALMLVGRVKLIYLVYAMIVMDLLLITSENAGGHIAHIGGAISGWGFIVCFKKGIDITAGFNRLLDRVVNSFKRKPKGPKLNDRHDQASKEWKFNAERKKKNEEIDRLLDKIKKSGYDTLTSEEKKKLFDASQKH